MSDFQPPRRDPPSSRRGFVAALVVAAIMAALLFMSRGEEVGQDETGSIRPSPLDVPR